MSNKLFVGSLPYSATDAQLLELFSAVGPVLSAKVITDRYSGQGKGFGFVEMENDELAQKAIQELNEKEFQGRKIFVSIARPQAERPPQDNRNFRGDNRDFRKDRRR